MKCDDVRYRFILLADDELPAEEAVAVRAHLADCEACGTAWRESGDLVAELHSYEPPGAPPGLRARIALALDTVDESKLGRAGSRRSPWEAAAFYLAAAAVLVMAIAVVSFLSRSGRGGMVAQAPSTYAPPVSTPAIPPGATVAAPAPTPPGTPANEAKAVDEAIKKLKEAQEKKALAERERTLLTTPPAPPTWTAETRGGEPSGKPDGTFAVGEPETLGTTAKPPTHPTVIDLSFLPPEKPTTGAAANGVVEIVAREDVSHAVVTATGDAGLTIGKQGGVVYEGPLHAGESVRVPVPMGASTPGSHEINLNVTSDAPGGNAQLKVFVPGFVTQPASKPAPTSADKPVNLVFQNAPIRQALMDIAKQAHLRLEIPEGLATERISRDVRGVPARAALRAVAEAGAYQITEDKGVFRVSRAANADH